MGDDHGQSDALPLVFLLLIYALPFVVVVVAFVVGVTVEKRHYESIRRREAATAHLPAVTARTPDAERDIAGTRLVAASVVISHDHFKRLLAALRKIIGGRLGAYESLLDRARREAVLRLKEQCADAHIILNLRLETSTIAGTRGRQGMGAVEVLAYGTAVRYVA